ncbi:MAG: 30S ribosomal protein S15 [archaeon]|nr:30S ribosomal protein S15 [archaeon]
MSRMHSGSKGVSGSKKPANAEKADWVELSSKQIEAVIVELANAGNTAAKIGIILRDQHGVPSTKRITKKRIQKILEEHKLLEDTPRDLLNLIKRSVTLHKHAEKNKKDQTAKRGYQLTVSKIRRLSKYYIKEKKLPENWFYTPEKAALMVK